MANKKFLVGILAMVLVFGFSGSVFAQSGGGTFTLTGIPSRFNGKYVKIHEGIANRGLGIQNWVIIQGFQSRSLPPTGHRVYTLSRIVNGRVSVPVWAQIEVILYDGRVANSIARYNGNHTFDEVVVWILNSATFYETMDEEGLTGAEVYFERISFSNGSATVSFYNNVEFEEF